MWALINANSTWTRETTSVDSNQLPGDEEALTDFIEWLNSENPYKIDLAWVPEEYKDFFENQQIKEAINDWKIDVSCNIVHLPNTIDYENFPEKFTHFFIEKVEKLSKILTDNNVNFDKISLAINFPRNQIFIWSDEDSIKEGNQRMKEIFTSISEKGFTKISVHCIDGNSWSVSRAEVEKEKREWVKTVRKDLSEKHWDYFLIDFIQQASQELNSDEGTNLQFSYSIWSYPTPVQNWIKGLIETYYNTRSETSHQSPRSPLFWPWAFRELFKEKVLWVLIPNSKKAQWLDSISHHTKYYQAEAERIVWQIQQVNESILTGAEKVTEVRTQLSRWDLKSAKEFAIYSAIMHTAIRDNDLWDINIMPWVALPGKLKEFIIKSFRTAIWEPLGEPRSNWEFFKNNLDWTNNELLNDENAESILKALKLNLDQSTEQKINVISDKIEKSSAKTATEKVLVGIVFLEKELSDNNNIEIADVIKDEPLISLLSSWKEIKKTKASSAETYTEAIERAKKNVFNWGIKIGNWNIKWWVRLTKSLVNKFSLDMLNRILSVSEDSGFKIETYLGEYYNTLLDMYNEWHLEKEALKSMLKWWFHLNIFWNSKKIWEFMAYDMKKRNDILSKINHSQQEN